MNKLFACAFMLAAAPAFAQPFFLQQPVMPLQPVQPQFIQPMQPPPPSPYFAPQLPPPVPSPQMMLLQPYRPATGGFPIR